MKSKREEYCVNDWAYLAEAKCREVQVDEKREKSIVFGHMEVYIDLDMNSFMLYKVLWACIYSGF